MGADLDIEEGVVIVHKDRAGFALLIDTEHLDTEFVGVCHCVAAAAAIAAAPTVIAVRRRN